MNSCRKQLMKDWWNEKNGVRKFPFLDFERLCHRRLTHLEKYPVLSLRFSLFHFGILSYWLDSDLIPRLLEIFEKLKTFMVILLSVKNDAYSRILSA